MQDLRQAIDDDICMGFPSVIFSIPGMEAIAIATSFANILDDVSDADAANADSLLGKDKVACTSASAIMEACVRWLNSGIHVNLMPEEC